MAHKLLHSNCHWLETLDEKLDKGKTRVGTIEQLLKGDPQF